MPNNSSESPMTPEQQQAMRTILSILFLIGGLLILALVFRAYSQGSFQARSRGQTHTFTRRSHAGSFFGLLGTGALVGSVFVIAAGSNLVGAYKLRKSITEKNQQSP